MHMHVCLLETASLLKTEARECRYTHVGFGTPPKAKIPGSKILRRIF